MIVTVSDESNYLLNVTKYMILSLSKFMSDEKLFVIVVNGSGRYDEKIATWHPNLSILHYEVKLENKRGLYFSFMALPLFDLMSKYNEPLIYIDGDVVIRSSLAPLFEQLKEYDLLVRYRPFCSIQGPMGTKYGGRVNSGVLALANTPQVLELVSEFKEKIMTFIEEGHDLISWNKEKTALTGIDQELLWVLIMEYKDKLNFFPLNDKYNDSYFKSDSVIWHAKGVARKKLKYLMECNRLDGSYIKYFFRKMFSIYVDLKAFIKSYLIETGESYQVKELEDVLLRGSIDSVVIINSSFFVENRDTLLGKGVICYDVDPVIYHNNKEFLEGIPHHFVVKDNDILIREREIDLLIYEESNEYMVSNANAKVVVVKQV
ncbi:hypothetical protein H2O73_10645 [Vibrio sp. 404]|uniref:Glycosyl transferase family 8 n=1 Tax=Vibrio marinisediminis TaxID=2758441 RepID=A0A7W2IU30_9VIBR|nr:hypothetical protein [Vibrio marinisediminis]MBA5762803.1 hypothetical protein [Vibrio marinisediminis]